MAKADALYHRLFLHPLMVEQLLREFVPDVMATGLDFARLERVVAKFHDRTGQRRESDVIWRLPTSDGSDIYLYLLIEFQSKSDWWMAVRTQVYEGLLWQQIIAEKKLKTGDRLPPLLLIVLYNGERRWSSPSDTQALIALPPGSPLWPWQPRVRYHVLDMAAVPGEDLIRRSSLAALLVRLEHRHEPEALAELIDDVIKWFRQHPDYGALKHLFTEMVSQAIDGVGMKVTIPNDLMEMRTMLATLGQSWKEQWKSEGLAEGRAKGLAEGKAEGLREGQARILGRLLEQRFGALSDADRTRVATSDPDTLDIWLDRVLDAETIEAVFESKGES